jgi:hypothetical protein
MNLFDKLSGSQGVKMLCGATIVVETEETGRPRKYSVGTAASDRQGKLSDYVLLALHYHGHVLARYPKTEARTYEIAGDLRHMIAKIIEEGVWPGSDLVRYAGASERLQVVAQPAIGNRKSEINCALIRPLLGDDLDVAVELPVGAADEELILSVVALLQGLMAVLDDDGVELLDRSLRYLRSYHDDDADYAAAGVAQNLANRAFREAGGQAA